MPEIQQLALDLIIIDQDIQTRDVTDSQQLDLFQELYRDEATLLPPVVVFRDAAGVHWLAHGHYRFCAAKEALSTEEPRSILAVVHEGTKRDAAIFAAGANATHGKQLTNEEKRIVVQRLLRDAEWVKESNRKIARHTGTSHVLVGTVRTELEDQAAASGNDFQIPATKTRTVQRGGTTYPMHTGGIGHSPRVPATPPADTNVAGDINGMECIVTKNLHGLMNAWRKANLAARRTFREWVQKQPIEEDAEVVTAEESKRYSSIIAEICKSLEGYTP